MIAKLLLCCTQVWLQRFAWTEQKLAPRVKKRNALPKDPTLLRDEPMFCFETAVKLLYWAGFVYEHEEVGPFSDTWCQSKAQCVSSDNMVMPANQANLYTPLQHHGFQAYLQAGGRLSCESVL